MLVNTDSFRFALSTAVITVRFLMLTTRATLSMRTRLMFIETHAAEVVVHATAIRLAKRCRSVVQACLREEEWHDADLEFYRIIREELEQWQTKPSEVQPPRQEER